jgi:serine/threonine protein kinase
MQHDAEGRPIPTHFLLLEYCDGGDLAEFLHACKRSESARGIDEATARRLLRMLAMGLHEMNKRHIVHVRTSFHCTWSPGTPVVWFKMLSI